MYHCMFMFYLLDFRYTSIRNNLDVKKTKCLKKNPPLDSFLQLKSALEFFLPMFFFVLILVLSHIFSSSLFSFKEIHTFLHYRSTNAADGAQNYFFFIFVIIIKYLC